MMIACWALLAAAPALARSEAPGAIKPGTAVELPRPHARGTLSVEEALARRRSVRDYARGSGVGLAEISQLLWAAQGITSAEGGRTAPSAGALYPIEVYLAVSQVDGVAPGVYRYETARHRLIRVIAGDRRRELAAAAYDQEPVRDAPAALVIAAVETRTAKKYGARAERYVKIEAGCVAENVALQAVASGLGTVVVGAFDDARLSSAVSLAPGEKPLLVMPFGKPR